MKVPVVRGVIDRRILVNYQIEPESLGRVLPDPLRPLIVNDVGIGGICLIRLRHIRPRFVPKVLGVASENAAHRIAVQWTESGVTKQGVYIPRRDTSSRLNVLAGGRLFPGKHHLAQFTVAEEEARFSVTLREPTSRIILEVMAHVTDQLSDTSAFPDLEKASEFFEAGSLGYSPSNEPDKLDGLELRTLNWHVAPLAVERVFSSFFEDPERFPADTVRFDSALLMQGIDHEWHAKQSLYCGESRRTAPSSV